MSCKADGFEVRNLPGRIWRLLRVLFPIQESKDQWNLICIRAESVADAPGAYDASLLEAKIFCGRSGPVWNIAASEVPEVV
jgi:hypothetical protein